MANLFSKIAAGFLLVIISSGCGDIDGGISSITVSPASPTVGVNQTQMFYADGKDSTGKNVLVSPTWSVTGNIGSIASTGLFTAGTVEATGKVEATSGTVVGSTSLTVTVKAWLEGTVTDTNFSKVAGMKVYLVESPALCDFTTTVGKYSIFNIPAGTYVAQIDAKGYYQVASKEVTVASGETVTWSPVLQGAPTTTVTTIPEF